MHKCIASTVEDEISGNFSFLDINFIRNCDNSISTCVCRKKNFTPLFFCPTKLKTIQCITNRAIKTCTVECLNEKLDNILKNSLLGLEKLIMQTISS